MKTENVIGMILEHGESDTMSHKTFIVETNREID